jgi:GMP synthase PP-ATPase subunit
MAIIKQGEALPPWDSLDDAEKQRLHQSVDAVLQKDGRGFAAEIVAIRSIGNRGDSRCYDITVFLEPPRGLLNSSEEVAALATRIINEVDGIGRVLLGGILTKNESGSP